MGIIYQLDKRTRQNLEIIINLAEEHVDVKDDVTQNALAHVKKALPTGEINPKNPAG